MIKSIRKLTMYSNQDHPVQPDDVDPLPEFQTDCTVFNDYSEAEEVQTDIIDASGSIGFPLIYPGFVGDRRVIHAQVTVKDLIDRINQLVEKCNRVDQLNYRLTLKVNDLEDYIDNMKKIS